MCRHIWLHAILMLAFGGTGITLICVYAPKVPIGTTLDTQSMEFILLLGGSTAFIFTLVYGCVIACLCTRPTAQQIYDVTAQMNAEVLASQQRRFRGYPDVDV